MQTVIYVDVLLAVNLLLTYILLLLTCAITKLFAKTSRLLIGSILGAAYSLTVLLPDIGIFLSVLMKIGMCISIVGITFQLYSVRQYIRCCLYFIFINAVFAGMVLLLQNTVQNSVVLYRNAIVYCNVDLPLLLTLSAISYVLLKLLFRLLRRNNTESVCLVKIYYDGISVETTAITDTGNNLNDPITGDPVSVVSFSVAEPLFSPFVRDFFKGDIANQTEYEALWKARLSLICADFAVGETILPAFRADKMEITRAGKKNCYQSCLIAVTVNTFENNDYKMLLHPSLMYEMKSDPEGQKDEIKYCGNRHS